MTKTTKKVAYHTRIALTAREFDTVIAALRLWQMPSAHIADGTGELADMAEENGEALTNAEIDALVERIN